MKGNFTNLSRILKNFVQDFGRVVPLYLFQQWSASELLKRKTKPQLKLIESFVISKFGEELCSKSYEKLPIISLG